FDEPPPVEDTPFVQSFARLLVHPTPTLPPRQVPPMRHSRSPFALAFLMLIAAAATATAAGPLVLWYQEPVPHGRNGALLWDHGMPIGNGRLGGVVFGQTAHERIQLNEDTLWAGGPRDTNNPEALKYLPEVRRLLFAGDPSRATKLASEKLM